MAVNVKQYGHSAARAYSISCLWVTIISTILLPAFRVGGIGVRIDDLIPILWVSTYSVSLATRDWRPIELTRLAFLLALAIILPLSIGNGIVNGYEGSVADLGQWFRIFKFSAIYAMAAVYFSDGGSPTSVASIISRCGWVLLAICLDQYFDFSGLTRSYVPYVAPTQWEAVVNHPTPRPVGMIGNPNEVAFLFVLVGISSIFLYVSTNKKTALLMSFLVLIGIMLTLSRTALVSYFISATVFLLFYFSRLFSAKALAISILAASSLAYSFTLPAVQERILWRFERALEMGGEDKSISVRIDHWQENLDMAVQHPILGVGPLRRADFDNAADNEWLLLWRSYGATGVLIFISFFAVPNIFIRGKEGWVTAWALTAAVFAYMVPAAAFHSLSLFGLVMVVLAIVDGNSTIYRRSLKLNQRKHGSKHLTLGDNE